MLPNAWDAGSARILEQVGFPAMATTNAGISWSCGVPDGDALDRDAVLDREVREEIRSSRLESPVCGGFWGGWDSTSLLMRRSRGGGCRPAREPDPAGEAFTRVELPPP